MKIKFTLKLIALAMLALLTLNSQSAFAQGTAFTYQGQLQNNGSPASGTYNLEFNFYTSASGGASLGAVTNSNVAVTNGLFTTHIDLMNIGENGFTNPPIWLEIAVETNSGNSFSTLSPRQELTPTPYAIYAENASNLLGVLPATQLSGTYNGAVTFNNASDSFVGSGAGLTGVNATTLNGYGYCNLPCYWNLAGNANTTPGLNFLGTTDGKPLEIMAGGGVGIGKPNPATALDVSGIVSATGLNFPATQITPDIINSGPSYLVYADNKGNFFSGQQAGASTMTSTSGTNNTGGGVSALANNTSGTANTAYGFNALFDNRSGSYNTAGGSQALFSNTSGGNNTANGAFALWQITSGNTNIALGFKAGYNFLGSESGNIDIGNQGVGSENNVIRIGTQGAHTNTYVAGIYGTTLPTNSSLVVVNSSGKLGTMGSLLDSQLPGNGSITINTGSGLSGGGTVFLGGSITLDASGTFSGPLNLPPTAVTNDYIFSGGQLMLFGDNNTNFFVGQLAGQSALSGPIGGENTGIGVGALYTIGSGYQNTADGAHTLDTDTTGSQNTAVGFAALSANTSGNNNVALGFLAGQNITTSSANIDIGNTGLTGDTGIIRLGTAGTQNSTYIAGIYATALTAGSPLVGVTSSGQLGTLFTGVGIGTNNPNGAPLRVVGSREGNSSQPIVLIENLDTTSSSSSALRVVANGGPTQGALSVSTAWGNGIGSTNVLIAQFGNASAYVSQLDNNGNWAANAFEVDMNGVNPGTVHSNALTFGATGNTGEGIASKRTSGGTQFDLEFYTSYNERMVVLNNGNVGIGNSSPGNLLTVGSGGAYCNGTTWVNGSDRNSKHAFSAINPHEVLEKVTALPISEWQYKAAPGQEHIGPMAQDFHAAFGLNGEDDTHISTVDEGGVALAAIQGLNQKLEEKNAEITELKARLDRLEQALSGK
jgi:hypothetical protein